MDMRNVNWSKSERKLELRKEIKPEVGMGKNFHPRTNNYFLNQSRVCYTVEDISNNQHKLD